MVSAQNPFSLDAVWRSLLDGDPGPALAFVDALIEHDMAFAAGGFLRDLAERYHDAAEYVDDDLQRQIFVTSINQVLLYAYDNDESSVAELLAEK